MSENPLRMPGASGVSLLLIEKGTPGFTQTPLQKMGWHSSDTAALFFDDCRVPVQHLIGAENQGFKAVMNNFNRERVFLAASANGFARVCLDEALAWSRSRKMFGGTLIDQQVTRHKLTDRRCASRLTGDARVVDVARRTGRFAGG